MYHDIFWLHVAVNYVFIMNILQSFQNLFQNFTGSLFLYWSILLYVSPQILAWKIFHYYVDVRIFAKDLMKFYYVRVAERVHYLQFRLRIVVIFLLDTLYCMQAIWIMDGFTYYHGAVGPSTDFLYVFILFKNIFFGSGGGISV